MAKTPEERFWEKVEIPHTGFGCWIWDGGILSTGYGEFRFGDKTARAHRVAWEMVHGPIPNGLSVCHTCDNRVCVNPSHLFLGTYSDNHQDKARKLRASKKLYPEDVLKIRNCDDTQRAIAKRFGICHSTVGAIRNRKIWGWLK